MPRVVGVFNRRIFGPTRHFDSLSDWVEPNSFITRRRGQLAIKHEA